MVSYYYEASLMSKRRKILGAIALAALSLSCFDLFSRLGTALKKLSGPERTAGNGPALSPSTGAGAGLAALDACAEERKKGVVFIGCNGIYN
jgi:hypothetical protein